MHAAIASKRVLHIHRPKEPPAAIRVLRYAVPPSQQWKANKCLPNTALSTMAPRAEKLYAVESPVPVALYPQLATILLLLGLCVTGSFFLYEVTKTRLNRSLFTEVMLAGVSSVFLGLGTLFLLLWTGVYV